MPKIKKIKSANPKPLALFSAHTTFLAAFTYLTSGVFLSGLAIFMGAGDVLLSYISVMVNICGVIILLLSSIIQRFRSRKKLAIWLTILSRFMTVVIVLIPLIFPKNLQIGVFLPAIIIAFTLQSQTTVTLNQWMLGFVEPEKSGRFISFRQTLTLIVNIVLSITGGYFMDYMGGGYLGFALVFSLAAVMGLVEVILLMRIPDTLYLPSEKSSRKFKDIIKLPVKNKPFLSFVIYIMLFYLLLYISDSFTMLYLIKYLALPYTTVNALYLIMSLPQVLLLGIWGKISDKFGHNFVLKFSIWLFAGETLFLMFASPQSWFIFIPISFSIAAVANAAFIVAVFNRRYELMPTENRIVYDNFYSAAIGIGFIVGPLIGGLIKGGIENNAIISASVPFASIRFLYIVSTVGILLLQIIYLIFMKKKNHTPPEPIETDNFDECK